MRASLSLARRSDRFAAGLLAVAVVAVAAAAFVPVGARRSDDAAASTLVLPAPPGAGAAGGYRRASPFDPQHRPVDDSAVLRGVPEPVVDIEPVAEAPALVAGILVSGVERRVMFAGGTTWQGIGSSFGRWTVAAIEPRSVTLSRGGERLVLDALAGR